MKFYIASGLLNVDDVRRVAGYLMLRGWIQTHDWTKNILAVDDAIKLCMRATFEFQGIQDSDIVIVLFPCGRGTHVEIGIALALHKPVIILARSSRNLYYNGGQCSFYYHPYVLNRFIQNDIDALADLAFHAGDYFIRVS